MTLMTVTITPLDGAVDARAFYELNAQWISQIFTLEDADLAVMKDPVGSVVAPGGAVFMARHGEQRIGCVAILPPVDGVGEIAKMAVDPSRRGDGIGRALLTTAIDHARSSGLRRLTLESSTLLVPAVRMYESVGFRHVPANSHAPSPYARADVFMDLDIP